MYILQTYSKQSVEFHAKVWTRRPSNCGQNSEKRVRKLQVTSLAL